MADSSIVISTELDNKELERQIAKARREIDKLEQSISDKEAKKSPLVEQAQALEEKIRAARAEVERYGAAWEAGVAGADKNQSAAITSAQQLAAQHAKVVEQIDKIDRKLSPAYKKLDSMKASAGGLERQLAKTSDGAVTLAPALNKADKYLDKFLNRVKGLARRVFIFTMITTSLRALRDWFSEVVKADQEAVSAIARLKGALLTLAQPLVEVIIPAFTTFVNILADIVGMVARMMAAMFSSTVEESAEAAEELHDEQKEIKKVGEEAKKASKSLANFDEINKLSGEHAKETPEEEEVAPDFSSVGDTEWLKNTLGDAAGLVAEALLLGGIALVAIGASMGSLPLVVAGLLLLGVGITVGTGTDSLRPWAEALGLTSVQEFVVVAVILGGIALVAIGAAMGNILLVLAGLGIIWMAIAYSESSGMMDSWTEEQISRAAMYITAALILGGIVLIAIGAATANILMVLAGLGLLAAGIYVGVKSGTLKAWAEVLGLDSVLDYVAAAIQLVGIVLICIGAAMGNIFMVIAGGLLITAGVITQNIGEQTLQSWWEKLQLTTVLQWVGVALLLVGVVMIAIGAVMGNIFMVAAGAVMLGAGVAVSMDSGNLSDWVTTLGLEKVAGWVTAALMLAGMALVFFGIMMSNALMVVAGIGLMVAGFVVGTESGTFGSWVDTLGLAEVPKWVSTALQLAGIALVAIGALTMNPLMIIAGLGLLGAGTVLRGANHSASKKGAMPTATSARGTMPSISSYNIPALASGAVIPPNREFLAVLGDQKSGTNIEAPVSEIEAAVERAIDRRGGGGEFTIVVKPAPGMTRYLSYELDNESRRKGAKLVKGGAYG